jgi:hypothetical protein
MWHNSIDSDIIFVDDQHGELESEAVLFVYETTQIDNENENKQVKLLKDPFDEFQYFLYHETGVHCVYLPWLENAKLNEKLSIFKIKMFFFQIHLKLMK